MDNPTLVFTGPGEVAVEDRERPTPDPGEALVETSTSLVSTGTELTLLSGEFPSGSDWDRYAEYPLVPGYCNIGTVIESGASAGLEPGTRVASLGTHAAYVTVDADEVTPIPDEVSDAEAAPRTIAQIVMNGVRRGRVDWGETVVVYGLGILGQLAVRVCHLAGAETVVGVDLADSRLDYLPDRPDIVGVNPDRRDPAAAVESETDGLADVCFEVTGNPDAIPDEFAVLREQGRLVLLSSPRGETTLDFHDHVNAPSYEIIGAHNTSHPAVATPSNPWTQARHARLFFSYLLQDRLDVRDLYSDVVPAREAPDLYRRLLDDRTSEMAVRLAW